MKKFSNELTDAEVERLAILAEEMGEAQQIIGKFLRHGYESYNPVVDTGLTNRRMLEKELGHVQHAIERMSEARDVNDSGILDYSGAKRQSIEKWLHHQLSSAPLGREGKGETKGGFGTDCVRGCGINHHDCQDHSFCQDMKEFGCNSPKPKRASPPPRSYKMK